LIVIFVYEHANCIGCGASLMVIVSMALLYDWRQPMQP
jgi:hypothetical protein